MRRTLYALFPLLLLTAAKAHAGADTLRVLFIGNSFTATNNLPDMVRQLAASAGDSLYYEMQAPAGATLQLHTSAPATLDAIATKEWDYVVLQEQSQRPAFPESQVEVEFYPWAVKMDSLVHAANPCVAVVFYNTWGYRNGDLGNCASFAPLCTFHGMDSMLRLRYTFMADSLNDMLCPVGPLFHSIRDASATMDLYAGDGSHPSLLGTFAAANAFYATLFGKSPMNASYVPTGIVAPEAQVIRTLATTHVYDSLAYWNQHYVPQPAPTAAFSMNVSGTTVTFINQSSDAVQYLWSFGDGETSADAAPTHTYATSGTYEVTLTATSCAGTSENTRMVEATLGVGRIAAVNQALRLVPNPTAGRLVVSCPAATDCADGLVVTNTFGQVVLRAPLYSSSTELDVQALPAGIYLVRTGTAVATFLKQ